ncbi:MAG: hypothetical protein ACI8X3_001660 [Saprospiraceae bacterium]|jgi:hypothetical protein
MLETTFSDRYKGFLVLLGVLTLISLLVMNDFTTMLESEEAFNILQVQHQLADSATQSLAPFPNTSQFLIYKIIGFSPFWIRISNVVVFLLLLLGIRVWGAKVFGKRQIITFMVLILSSFLMISLAKFAVADIPLCAFHMMSMAFLVICMKQPKLKWQIVYGLFVMGSFLVQPTGAVIYGLGLLAYMLLFHKDGKNLLQPLIIGIWIGLGTLFYFLGGFEWSMEGFIFSYRSGPYGHVLCWKEFFTWQVIGILPWLGFLPAALWDLFQKLRKKEEMAIILFGWLLFSIISHAVILQLCLLFLISKQVENYFKPNYPYKNLIKTFSILNLVCTFFVLIALMLGGFAAMHNIGFRSTAAFSGIYWVFGFIAIIGLFSDSRRFIIGGFGLAGSFSLFLFWLQINPIVNRFRDISIQLLDKVEEASKVAVSQPLFDKNQFKVYSNAKGIDSQAFINKQTDIDCYLLNEDDYKKLLTQDTIPMATDTLKGRTYIFERPELFFIVKNKK